MKRHWILTPIVLAVIAAASYAAFLALRPPDLPEGIVYANGRVEGTEIRVSAEVAGRVVQNEMQEGQQVEAGDPLVTLADEDYVSRLDQAQASAEAIEQELRSLSIEQSTWQHHLTTAKDDLARLQSLRQEDIVTPQQLDVAEDRVEETSGAVRRLDASIAQAEARLHAAQHEIAFLQQQVSKTRIASPIDATLLVKAIEAGEYVSPGQPVALLVDMSALKLKVYVPETEIGKIRMGAAVRVRVDAFPQRFFEGTVTSVDQQAQFTPKDIHLPEERARVVFGVDIALDNTERYLKPGMPADAWIRWKDNVSWPDLLTVPRE